MYNRLVYRVFPDDLVGSDASWLKADKWAKQNIKSVYGDFNEAVSFAKLGALSCNHPFIVQKIPVGGSSSRLTMTNVWEVFSGY